MSQTADPNPFLGPHCILRNAALYNFVFQRVHVPLPAQDSQLPVADVVGGHARRRDRLRLWGPFQVQPVSQFSTDILCTLDRITAGN